MIALPNFSQHLKESGIQEIEIIHFISRSVIPSTKSNNLVPLQIVQDLVHRAFCNFMFSPELCDIFSIQYPIPFRQEHGE